MTKRKIKIALVTVVIGVLLITNVFSCIALRRMEDRLENLESAFDGNHIDVENTVRSTLDSFAKTKLQMQDNVISNFYYEFMGFDAKDKTVNFLFSVTPKEYKKNMKVEFIYGTNEEDQQRILATEGEDYEYTAKVSVPAVYGKDLKSSVVLDYSDVKKMQDLETIYDPMRMNALTLEMPGFSGSYSYEKGKAVFQGSVKATYYSANWENSSNTITEMNFYATLNGKTVTKKAMKPAAAGSAESEDSDENRKNYQCSLDKVTIPMKKGDILEFKVVGKDVNGLTYTNVFERIKAVNDGNGIESNYKNEETIISF